MPTAEELRAQIAGLQKELERKEAEEAMAARAGDAKRAIALLSAMKLAKSELERVWPGLFEGEKWAAIVPQAWPRQSGIRRQAGLSETEADNAKKAGEEAVMALRP